MNTCATTSTSSRCRTSPTRCRWARSSRRCRVHRVPGCSSGNQRPRTRRRTTGDRSTSVSRAGAGPPVSRRERPACSPCCFPQAEMVTVNLSSYLHRRHPGAVRSVDDPAQHLPSVAPTPTAARRGTAWMLTPSRAHAGAHREKPLAPPVIEVPAVGVPNTGVQRFVGETFAVLSGVVQNHAKSTARSTWKRSGPNRSTTCSKTAPTASRVPHTSVTSNSRRPRTTCRIDRDDAPASGTQPPRHELRHEFKDTKHRTSHIRPPRRRASASTSRRRSRTTAHADHAHRTRGPAGRSVVAPSGSAATFSTSSRRGRSRNRPSAASRYRTGSDVPRRPRLGPAPAAGCVSTWTARGGHRVSTSCSAWCSRTSRGSLDDRHRGGA